VVTDNEEVEGDQRSNGQINRSSGFGLSPMKKGSLDYFKPDQQCAEHELRHRKINDLFEPCIFFL